MAKKCPKCGATLPSGTLAGLCPACLLAQGAMTDTETSPKAPPFEPLSITEMTSLFPQFEIVGFIGKGGMGAVYKARQRDLDRWVALKILPPRADNGAGFTARFSREARALARLNHPNIVAVYEFGQVKEMPFFVMEFVDGLNLRQLERAGRLAPTEALKIIPQICEALQFAHEAGIVHRDIKPENILLDKQGRVKIADFGIAKIAGPELPGATVTETRQSLGTPHYMAPEQVEQPQSVDHRADIFSLGVVFYEMLTGELPLGKFAPPSRKVQVDVRLDDVVLRALEKEPELRYQHASQMKTDMETIASGPAPAANASVMVPISRMALGMEYKSSITWRGLPLLHVATGINPATGKMRVATGVIAIGNVARGIVAIGGMAFGVIAFGGGAVGVFALGGGAIGVASIGGGAIALLAAFGGGAVAPIAIGGGAVGYLACGGGAVGSHCFGANSIDTVAWDFFQPWVGPFFKWSFIVTMLLSAVAMLGNIAFMIWLKRKEKKLLTSEPAFWLQIIGGLIGAAVCIAPLCIPSTMAGLDFTSRLGLVEGRVTSASGKGIENAVIEDRGRKTETDTDGYFQLVVTRKNWNLNVSSDAYASVSTNGVFNYKHHAQVQVSLAPNAIAPGAALWAPIAKKWLSLLDQEAYSKSWLETSAQFRDEVASITWEKQMDSIRRPVGNLTSRFFISADEEDNLAGAQKGRYAIIQFQSSFVKKNSVDPNVHVMTPPNVDQSSLFESKRDAIESVTLELEKDGVWRVSGYFIK